MDIDRIRALRELAARGTMAAAADALCLTPSAISQQISRLELDAGIKLTERQGRGVRLTHAGAVLIAHGERLMTVLEEARSELALIKREIAGLLRVAAFPTVAAALLPHTIEALKCRYPRLDIVFDELEPADGLAGLRSWQIDLAFTDNLTSLSNGKQQCVDQVAVCEDVLYVLLSPRHRLARRRTLDISDLKDELWALDSASSNYAEFLLGVCRRAGYEPRVNARCRGFEMVRAMVASGCSIAIIPGLRLVRAHPDVRAIRLRPEVRRKISIAYRRGERNHPAIKAFVEQLVRSSAEILK